MPGVDGLSSMRLDSRPALLKRCQRLIGTSLREEPAREPVMRGRGIRIQRQRSPVFGFRLLPLPRLLQGLGQQHPRFHQIRVERQRLAGGGDHLRTLLLGRAAYEHAAQLGARGRDPSVRGSKVRLFGDDRLQDHRALNAGLARQRRID